jgi:hypothetical protein
MLSPLRRSDIGIYTYFVTVFSQIEEGFELNPACEAHPPSAAR